MINQRNSFLSIGRDSSPHNLFAIIIAPEQFRTVHIALFVVFRWMKINIIDALASWTRPSTGYSLNHFFFGDFYLNRTNLHMRLQYILKLRCLMNIPRISIQNKSFLQSGLAIRSESSSASSHHPPVPFIHDRLYLSAQRRIILNCMAKHISCRNLRYAFQLGKIRGLSALSSSGRAQKNDHRNLIHHFQRSRIIPFSHEFVLSSRNPRSDA